MRTDLKMEPLPQSAAPISVERALRRCFKTNALLLRLAFSPTICGSLNSPRTCHVSLSDELSDDLVILSTITD